MKIEPPNIDERTFGKLVTAFNALLPHYTPEWSVSDERDPGTALLKISAYIIETVLTRLNQAPRKDFVAFLDMLGIKLLPAQPARVPLAFKLAKGTEKEILIPERTQAAADKTEEHEELPFETERNLLATPSKLKQVISVDPSLDRIYIHTPGVLSKDGDISLNQSAFTLFSGENRQEHSLYLGHRDIFNMKSTGTVFISVTLTPGGGAGRSLAIGWEYWGEDKKAGKNNWMPFYVSEDTTNGLRQGGAITLMKTVEGEIKEEKLEEIFKQSVNTAIKDQAFSEMKTRWIRCRLKDPLISENPFKLPGLDTIFIKTAPAAPIKPDAGFFNDVPLNMSEVTIQTKIVVNEIPTEPDSALPQAAAIRELTVESTQGFKAGDHVQLVRDKQIEMEQEIDKIKGANSIVLKNYGSYKEQNGDILSLSDKVVIISPFGTQPKLYDSFYIGTKEGFSKKGATIDLTLSLSHLDTLGTLKMPEPRLSWEYWNGKGWSVLVVDDETDGFLAAGERKTIRFVCPEDIQEIEVNGQKNYWVRVKLISGEYGWTSYEHDRTGKITSIQQNYKIPVMRDLAVQYFFEQGEELECCFSYNNLDFRDCTQDSQANGKPFSPFVSLEEDSLTLFLGFEGPLSGGPIRIFFAANELKYGDEEKPKVDWSYRGGSGWSLLDCFDETDALIMQGHLELNGPPDFTSFGKFGDSLYWICGELAKGKYSSLPRISGIYPNATWAVQAATISQEILGSSDGSAGQNFSFLKSPVLSAEEIRVKEVLSEEERQFLMSTGKNALFEVKDEKGVVTESWVLWTEIQDFYYTEDKARNYVIDRAAGQIRFGDGNHGMIPPAGENNIKAFSYRSGGGRQGNVRAGEIKTLKSSLPGVDKVFSVLDADGGADTTTVDEILGIGPSMISSRNRAVTARDFEFLAKQASRKIAKARCLSNINSSGQGENGWVTVIIIPDSPDPKPYPSLLLRNEIRRYLEEHAATTVAADRHIHVEGPSFAEIGISGDIVATSIDSVIRVEREVKQKIQTFLHPLTGGPEGEGWEFGRDVAASDIYAFLEEIEGVDHVENLKISCKFPVSGGSPQNGQSGGQEEPVHEGYLRQDVVKVPKNCIVCEGAHVINVFPLKERSSYGPS